MSDNGSSENGYWDGQAASFDDEPDHGLLDPAVRGAWADLLLPLLPGNSARVADIGCGTGTLSVLLAGAGHRVSGVDFASRMVEAATAKARDAGVTATFRRGDAQRPPLPANAFDVVLCRHVLWALPDPVDALRSWTRLLGPGGMLLLVEGSWLTGAGITGAECSRLVLQVRRSAELLALTDPTLWGRTITDERFLVLSRE